MSEQLIKIIRTASEIEELKTYLLDKDYIAFDTETTGVEYGSEIIGFSVCAETNLGYYVILAEWAEGRLNWLETREQAKEFLFYLKTKNLVMHNGVFDCSMVERNFGVYLIESLHTDTLILAHLLNENRNNGLKELGVSLYGEDARKEQKEMKDSVSKNGGSLTKANYELYKADADLIAKYGAKDAILTLKIFYLFIEELYAQNLYSFFFEESMPLLKGPTYDLNTTGLKVDQEKLSKLKGELEAECLELRADIYKQIHLHVKDKYPGTGKTNTFNIGSTTQLSWLLFDRLGNEFHLLTPAGKEFCKFIGLKIPYTNAAKREFIDYAKQQKGIVWKKGGYDFKKKKNTRDRKVEDFWHYLAVSKSTLSILADKYDWIDKLLKYKKNMKLLQTYIVGIQERAVYNTIRPSFFQHGTSSGRYSSKNPNFQNLPRDDKRVKGCIISRPGKTYVGADQSQLEPRVFASLSGDEKLLRCFSRGEDFYSVIGTEVFNKPECSLIKEDENSFAKRFPDLRNLSKVIGLAATYGASAFQLAPSTKKSIKETEYIIAEYFHKFPKVKKFMDECHSEAKKYGQVVSLFGRPRRIPDAKNIEKLYGHTDHDELPYEARKLLNIAVNHKVQSTGSSIMNRAAIAFCEKRNKKIQQNQSWKEVKITLQVHDEIIVETPLELSKEVADLLQDCMENTVSLPGVRLKAEPKIATNLAELK